MSGFQKLASSASQTAQKPVVEELYQKYGDGSEHRLYTESNHELTTYTAYSNQNNSFALNGTGNYTGYHCCTGDVSSFLFGGGNDIYKGNGKQGNHTLGEFDVDGGGGFNTAIFPGRFADYDLKSGHSGLGLPHSDRSTLGNGYLRVKAKDAPEEALGERLFNFQRLQFQDRALVIQPTFWRPSLQEAPKTAS